MKTRAACVVVAVALLNGCTPQPPAPLAPPSLVSVGLRGAQVCGPFTTAVDGTLAFVCLPFPTATATGWELNPDWYTDAQNKLRPNKTAIMTVTTASGTGLEVSFKPAATSFILRNVPPGRYAVPPVIHRQGIVEVSAVDSGTVKTWTVRGRTDLCRDVTPLEFRTVSAGSPTSAPLLVTLIRAPSADRCLSSGGPGFTAISGGPPPPPTGTPPACPGGASRQHVILCLHCPKDAPKGLWDAESDEVCSPATYLAQRRAAKPTCDVWQVPTIEACVYF
jgi:hypothetical protein